MAAASPLTAQALRCLKIMNVPDAGVGSKGDGRRSSRSSGTTSAPVEAVYGGDISEDSGNEVELNIDAGERNIWDLAKRDAAAKLEAANNTDYPTTLFVLGNKSVGKSTIIKHLLNKKETATSTTGLEFCYGKRKHFNRVPEIVHIWELGGSAVDMPDLIELPICSNDHIDSFTLVIVLDLSEPMSIWEVFEVVLDKARLGFQEALDKCLPKQLNLVLRRLTDRMLKSMSPSSGSDMHQLENEFKEIFPIPLAIIGTKYDQFEAFDPELKEKVCRNLRLLAHKLGASLCFYTSKEVSMNRQIMEFLSHYAYKTPFPSDLSWDFNKPLLIPHGGDSFLEIAPGIKPRLCSLDYIKDLFKAEIGIKARQAVESINPGTDPRYAEPSIDRKRKEVMEKLERRIQDRQEREAREKIFF